MSLWKQSSACFRATAGRSLFKQRLGGGGDIARLPGPSYGERVPGWLPRCSSQGPSFPPPLPAPLPVSDSHPTSTLPLASTESPISLMATLPAKKAWERGRPWRPPRVHSADMH